jgi:NagD protein
MFHRALRKLADMMGGTRPENIVVIGDTMETDIRGAIEAGLQAYLVLSGATALDVVADYVYQPTRVLNSVADLIEELESGKPSNRLDSPVYSQARPARPRLGNRHQTDAEQPVKSRPRPPMTR